MKFSEKINVYEADSPGFKDFYAKASKAFKSGIISQSEREYLAAAHGLKQKGKSVEAKKMLQKVSSDAQQWFTYAFGIIEQNEEGTSNTTNKFKDTTPGEKSEENYFYGRIPAAILKSVLSTVYKDK